MLIKNAQLHSICFWIHVWSWSQSWTLEYRCFHWQMHKSSHSDWISEIYHRVDQCSSWINLFVTPPLFILSPTDYWHFKRTALSFYVPCECRLCFYRFYYYAVIWYERDIRVLFSFLHVQLTWNHKEAGVFSPAFFVL